MPTDAHLPNKNVPPKKKQARRKKTAARFVYMVDKANREGKRGILMKMKRAGLFAAVLCAVSLIAAVG